MLAHIVAEFLVVIVKCAIKRFCGNLISLCATARVLQHAPVFWHSSQQLGTGNLVAVDVAHLDGGKCGTSQIKGAAPSTSKVAACDKAVFEGGYIGIYAMLEF